jgi:hypothetical protein
LTGGLDLTLSFQVSGLQVKGLNLVFSKPSLEERVGFNLQFSGFKFASKKFKLGFFKTKS